MPTTTSSIIPAPVQEWYNRATLERALPALVHDRFGQKTPVPANSGEQPKYRRYGSLTVADTPLVEGTPPTEQEMSKTDITGQLQQYGSYVKFSDYVMMTSQDRILTELAELNGENAGETLDCIYRDTLVGGSSVFCAGGVASRDLIATEVAKDDLRKIIRSMKAKNAKFFKEMQIPGSDKVGTQPIAPAFFAIIDAYTEKDLKDNLTTDFIPVYKYGNPSMAMPDEVGAFEELRFILSSNAKVYPNATDGHVSGAKSTGGSYDDVHVMLIFGMNAYAITPLGGKNLENVVKPIGSAGANDPINQYGTSGWKATTDIVILNDDFMYRYEYLVSA